MFVKNEIDVVVTMSYQKFIADLKTKHASAVI